MFALFVYPVFWIFGVALLCPSPLIAAETSPFLDLHTYTPKKPDPAPLDNSFKLAAVCFAGGDCVDNGDYSDPAALCLKFGFAKTGGCPANEQPGQYCGYNSSYFDRCCNKAYAFTAANCSYPNYLSSDNCSGKHKCLCDRRLFPVAACTAPEEPKDPNDVCKEISYNADGTVISTTHYSGCKCPDDYKICGKNQQGVGSPCQSVYYQECKCKTGYTDVCYEFGPLSGHEQDFCLLDGTKYFQPKHCKTCANRGTLDSCPTGFACILEQCSAKYYVTGCNVSGGYNEITDCDWIKCVSPFQYYEKPEE